MPLSASRCDFSGLSGVHVEVSALVAEPGPLVAMKLQAIMNRAAAKQGADAGLTAA
jgi:hypothetical protein